MQQRGQAMDRLLRILKYQKNDILNEDSQKLALHSDLEHETVALVEILQKCIDGLRKDEYRRDNRLGDSPGRDGLRENESRFEELEQSFQASCDEALRLNRENQKEIRQRMGRLSHDLARVKNLRAKTGSSHREPQNKYIDIQT